jgi:NADPH-dependent 2,4-dienoyl-CoA reductase/sulfur reductase-like enzyme/nitrite reductase/ring-hydroxylating ferredoxin subunit
MADTDTPRPDFKKGLPFADLPDGKIVSGTVDKDEVILLRRGDEIFALGAHCTHYHGPLADGLVVGDTIRCPWHHACFNLRTGDALRAPALDPVTCWRVERSGDTVYVREKRPAPAPPAKTPGTRHPASVLIIGGGAAGLAAADMLRRRGYDGTVTILSRDEAGPVDRPNLSKDFLAGTAKEDWIPLRSDDFYTDQKIELVLRANVAAIDLKQRQVQLDGGKTHTFEALLIATGADPVRLDVPGAATSQIHYLRTFADSKAIVARAESARSVVVVGASFIGLEVAASLRARKLDVHVVAPEAEPLARVMGPEVGRVIRGVHEEHGVVFHLGKTVAKTDGRKITLSDGAAIDADFVVLGVGVRPAIGLAERAGLTIDRGISVNEYLETSASGVFAAGDIARWPDRHSGERIRVEHWVVAERQGQTAAKNILGEKERFDTAPFFWSQHYDAVVNYVGHAERWDKIDVDGDLDARDFAVRYKQGGRTLAVATMARDLASLEAEAAMER